MGVPRFITFVVRTIAEPASVLADVRRAILSEDPTLPITGRAARLPNSSISK